MDITDEGLWYDENDPYSPILREKLDLDDSDGKCYPGKCPLISTKFRKKGSYLFNQRKQDEMIHRAILSYYAKSIAYAPTNSEELALAYSNRSLLWLRLNKHEFCSVDINRALKISKSIDLKKKLIARKWQCLDIAQFLEPNDRVVSEIPSIPLSKSIPCGADCIRVEFSEEDGKHLVATRDIEAGEIILDEQTPYACVDLHNLYLVCSHCMKYAWIGVPCESCVFTIYCSESCRIEAWFQYHDVICPMLPYLMSKAIRNVICPLLTILRMLIITVEKEGLDAVINEAKKIDEFNGELQFDSEYRFNCKKFSSIYALKSKFDEESLEKGTFDLGLDHHITILLRLLNKSSIMTDNQSQSYSIKVILSSFKTVLKKLFVIYSSNNFKFEDLSLFQKDSVEMKISDRGNILGPCSSLINHSCDPNISRIFLPGPRIIMFTIRPVKEGEQIRNSYGPNAVETKEMRQQQLRETFSFECKCKPCVEDWSDYGALKIDPSKMDMLSKKIHDILGADADMILQPREKWPCSQNFLKKVSELCGFIYQHFDEAEAFWISESYRWYINACFNEFYCEDLELLKPYWSD